ncbi:MAG: N-acetyltransferase, partial [Boseongicola sp.]|nr:N-acetyltransferase [Boseongicola sp.]
MSDIRKEVSGAKGRFVLVAPEGEAELTYSRASPTLVVADHTAVPDAMRGTG